MVVIIFLIVSIIFHELQYINSHIYPKLKLYDIS